MAVGLLTDRITLSVHTVNLGLTHRQDRQLCRDEKDDSVHMVSQCPALACKRYRTLGFMFLKPKDLQNMRGNDLISLAANTLTSQRGDTIELLRSTCH